MEEGDFVAGRTQGFVLSRISCIVLLTTLFIVSGSVALAGGGPRNVAVVVNKSSSVSQQVADYYINARQIPESNVCEIVCPTDELIDWQTCESHIRGPIREFLSRPEMSDRIDFIVLTKGMPLKVDVGDATGSVSLTSILVDTSEPYVDNDSDGKPDNACTFASPYGPLAYSTWGFTPPVRAFTNKLFNSDEPGDPYDIDKKLHLVTRLDAFDVEDIQQMIDDSMSPAMDGLFLLDRNSSVSGAYGTANNRLGTMPTSAYWYLDYRSCDIMFEDGTGDFLNNVCGIMGYFSWSSHDSQYTFEKYTSNTFVPGAIGDTYYSYSGRTFTDPETTDRGPLIADLLAAGLSGAGGYVSEPYIQTATFPNTLFDRYTQGFNLAESFYAACSQINWKTVIVGDPLLAPYATPPMVSFGLPDNTLSGIVNVNVMAIDESGVDKVELYLDDILVDVDESAPFEFVIDSTAYAVGGHKIEAVAYEDSVVETQGIATEDIIICNTYSAVESIGDVKQYSDGQGVQVTNKIVTAGTASIGDGFYIQDTVNPVGIRVVSTEPVSSGDILTVIGTVQTIAGERVINAEGTTITSSGNQLPRPFTCQISALGGAGVQGYDGVGKAYGARNVGLRVQVCGTVTNSLADSFAVSDGSTDGPVLVDCTGLTAPADGSFVCVTGICTVGAHDAGEAAYEAVLKVVAQEDIILY